MADQHNDDVHKHYRLYLDDDWHCIAMANVREFHETEHEALSAARAHRAAVVESSPEVAALRARVAELETALAEATRSDPVWEQIDALARRVIATAPKPRDESVPPPDWSLHPCTVHGRPGLQVHRNDETGAVIDGLMLCAGDVVPRSEADAVTRALWAKYDREHGYAPDEASIRADERARCESEVERLRAAVATMREQVLQSAAFCGAPGFACRGAMAQAVRDLDDLLCRRHADEPKGPT